LTAIFVSAFQNLHYHRTGRETPICPQFAVDPASQQPQSLARNEFFKLMNDSCLDRQYRGICIQGFLPANHSAVVLLAHSALSRMYEQERVS
jgi:hypothetical protein